MFKISGAKCLTMNGTSALVGMHAAYAVTPVCKHRMLRNGVRYDCILIHVKEVPNRSDVHRAKKNDLISLHSAIGN